MWTRDLLSLSFRQKMEGYSEVLLQKVGEKQTVVIITLKMISHGYFLFIIPLNLELSNLRKGARFATITNS